MKSSSPHLPTRDEIVAAIFNRNSKALRTLITGAKRPCLYDEDGMPLIHVATFYNSEETVALMLAQGCPPDLIWDGCTVLKIACTEEAFECARTLIKHGANVNWQDERGDTPLIHAVLAEDGKMVPLLLSVGADPNIKDQSGFQAIDFANDCEDKEIGNEIWKAMQAPPSTNKPDPH